MKHLTQQEWLELIDRIDALINIVRKDSPNMHIIERLLDIKHIIEK